MWWLFVEFGMLTALWAAVATAQTATPAYLAKTYVASCFSPNTSDDPNGFLLFGGEEDQYVYNGVVYGSSSSLFYRLFPPLSAPAGIQACQTDSGDGSNRLLSAPGLGNSVYRSQLYSGQVVSGNESESFAGAIQLTTFEPNGNELTVDLVDFRFPAGSPSAQTGAGDTPTGIVRSASGSLIGGTAEGGRALGGTVFQLTPRPDGGVPWTETVLHAFGGAQGGTPVVWIAAPDGAVYGTTEPSTDGTIPASVWRLALVGKNWSFSVLHQFADYPSSALSPLVRGPDGSLYGTVGAPSLGRRDNGDRHGGKTLYRLTPPPAGDTRWGYSVAYTFPIPTTTVSNLSTVTSDGTIYGYTDAFSSPCKAGSCGRIWQIKPPRTVGASYTGISLYDYPAPVSENSNFVRVRFRHDPSGVALYALPAFAGSGFAPLIRITETGWN